MNDYDFDVDGYPESDYESYHDALAEADEAMGDYWDDEDEDGGEDGMSDVEADADTLASAGYGTDEDYGVYEGDDDFYGYGEE